MPKRGKLRDSKNISFPHEESWELIALEVREHHVKCERRKRSLVYFMNEFSDLVSHNGEGGLNLRNIIQNKNKIKKRKELQNRIVS